MGVVVQHLGSYIRDRRAVVEVVPKSQSDRIREFSTTFSVSSGDLFEILEHLATLSRKQHGTCMDLQCDRLSQLLGIYSKMLRICQLVLKRQISFAIGPEIGLTTIN